MVHTESKSRVTSSFVLWDCVPRGVSSNSLLARSWLVAAPLLVPVFRSVPAMSGPESSVEEAKSDDAKEHEETASVADSASAASSGAGRSHSDSEIVLGSSGLLDQIQKLRVEQQSLRSQKKQLAKDMKNAVKKKKRLQTRASLLTDVDLVEVLRMRKARRGAGDEQPGAV